VLLLLLLLLLSLFPDNRAVAELGILLFVSLIKALTNGVSAAVLSSKILSADASSSSSGKISSNSSYN